MITLKEVWELTYSNPSPYTIPCYGTPSRPSAENTNLQKNLKKRARGRIRRRAILKCILQLGLRVWNKFYQLRIGFNDRFQRIENELWRFTQARNFLAG